MRKIYVKTLGGALVPAYNHKGELTILGHGEQFVQVEEVPWVPPKPKTLMDVLIEWEYGARVPATTLTFPILDDLARRIRQAFPEAGL